MADPTELQILAATRLGAAATLAAALITASGRVHSVNEAVKLLHDIQMSLFPSPSSGRYQTWKKEFKGDNPHT